MAIPYRTKRVLWRMFVTVLILLLVAVLIWGCWAIWLGRYMVYTRNEGVRLDFNKDANDITGDPVTKPLPPETVSIYYNEGENLITPETELTQMVGYYVTADELEEDIAQIMPQVRQLEKGTPVMVDVKSIYGNFFYNSKLSTDRNSDLDPDAMDKFIRELNQSGAYTIARVPAFRDFKYGLSHVNDGLPTAGGYLWMDDQGCYWLNPASQGTLSYLVQIVSELRGMGFDEVVFYDFRFPETTGIVFNGDKDQALSEAAATLVSSCASESFAVSFVGGSSFPLPQGRSRLYVENAAAADAQSIALNTGLEDPSIYLVFLTELHDTRFDDYSVLRPLSAAH